jgi:cellulose biosynthesis protein BcsQ
MKDTKPRIIAYVSGKGGSGKTTVAIAVGKLLADIGHPCLLIDFDLATNGASYFFKGRFEQTSKGIWEMLSKNNSHTESSNRMNDSVVTISENFYFVPSRTKLNVRSESYDTISYDSEYLKEQVLNPLLDYATQKGAHYILIDCQAGFSISSIAAAESADRAIIVTEADAISNDAADNLLIQFGSSLPDERRYLVNKIDVRDADTYRTMRNVFQSLNRLPPLPFDFDVRNAFGARQIPINLKTPSPFLFALFETVKYMFPEIFEDIAYYKKEHVDSLFEEYDHKLKSLTDEKRVLDEEQASIKTRNHRLRSGYIQKGLIFLSVLFGIAFVLTIFALFDPWIYTEDLIIYILVTGTFAFFVMYGTLFYRQMSLRKLKDEIRTDELSRRLQSINQEMDRFRSFLWARSRDFLVDAEVVGETNLIKVRSENGTVFHKEDNERPKDI